MTQEKQKVIRVLKPTQKKKNLSPIYYGIAGLTFGIAVTSVLIFSVLGNDSSNNQIMTQNPSTAVNEQSSDDQAHTVSTKSNPTLAAANSQKEELDHNSTDDFDQPQTKLKDIPNAFKQEKQITAEQTNRNPFANAIGSKEANKPVLNSEKTVLKKPIVTANRVNKAQPTANKATPQKAEPKIQAKTETVTAKAKTVQNENDVDLPKATVQISVTRSVKE